MHNKQNGTLVRAKVPRFEDGKFNKGLMIEEASTNRAFMIQMSPISLGIGTSGVATIDISEEYFYIGSSSVKYSWSSGTADIYLVGTSYFTQTAATSFTTSWKVRRSDGGVIGSLTGSISVANNSDTAGDCTITDLGNGWYNVSLYQKLD